MRTTRSKTAISHNIAVVLLVAIAVGVAFVTYLFVMNYVGLSTTKSGKAIQIQTMNIANGRLTVYVQNVGQETVNFNPASCIYTNGILDSCTIDKTALLKGETATITVDGFTNEPSNVTVKVTTTDGTSTEETLR